MEYIFTNLPQYIRVTSRTEFSSSVVHSGSVLLFSEDGTSLTAKLPDGSFITVGGSGGTDVSDTTAIPSTVLAGEIFYDSTGSRKEGTMPIVSAEVTSGAVVVPSGYIPTSQSFPVSSGADVTLGYISGGVFYELAFSGTSSVEAGSSAGLSNYGWNLPQSPIPNPSAVVISSGLDVVSSAAIMSGEVLNSNYYMYVSSGGIANSTTLNAGGLRIFSGGTANYTTINLLGDIIVFGGIANTTTVNSGGYLHVSSGGIGNIATVSSGGTMHVYSGGTALSVTSMTGAAIVLESGGHIEYVNSGNSN